MVDVALLALGVAGMRRRGLICCSVVGRASTTVRQDCHRTRACGTMFQCSIVTSLISSCQLQAIVNLDLGILGPQSLEDIASEDFLRKSQAASVAQWQASA